MDGTTRERPGRNKDTRLAIWNIGMLTAMVFQWTLEVEMVEKMKKYRVDLLGISELKNKRSGTNILHDWYALLYSGVNMENSACEGVGVIVKQELHRKVEQWEPVSSTIITRDLQMTASSHNYTSLCTDWECICYRQGHLYSDLQSSVNRVWIKNRWVIVCGDLNARAGNNTRDYAQWWGLMVEKEPRMKTDKDYWIFV